MRNTATNKDPFLTRLYQYQKERFPFLMNGLMIIAFTFSAASFSRLCRDENGFIALYVFVAGAVTSFLFFFLLRIFDEFKDYEKDCTCQPYRPVPRGLITLKELKWLALGIILFIIILNTFLMPVMLVSVALVMTYMFFMTKEFFVKQWLIKHPLTYLWTHMLIMPLIDFYTTGLDWLNEGIQPPEGLIFFLLVTYFNGVIIEVGRKIKCKETEETGVETYSALYGLHKATIGWLGVLIVTYVLAIKACLAAGSGIICILVLTFFVILCAAPAMLFYHFKTTNWSKGIEISSGIWTVAMYLTLGGVPMAIQLLFFK